MIETTPKQKTRLKSIDEKINALMQSVTYLQNNRQAYVDSILDGNNVNEGDSFEQTEDYNFVKIDTEQVKEKPKK